MTTKPTKTQQARTERPLEIETPADAAVAEARAAGLLAADAAAAPVAPDRETPPDLASAEAHAAGLAVADVPVTPMAPATQPAAAVHEEKPTAIGSAAAAVADWSRFKDIPVLRPREGLPVGVFGRADPLPVGAQPLPPGQQHVRPILDRLAHHPDAVVRARAAEAIAARNSGGADAGILARATVDTAAELDRSAGRLSAHTARDGALR